jgi:hypothetical protein
MNERRQVPTTTERVLDMLDAARNSPTGRRLAESGFDVDMADPEQADAIAMHVLHQLQVLDAAMRLLASRVRDLQTRIDRSESLFV